MIIIQQAANIETDTRLDEELNVSSQRASTTTTLVKIKNPCKPISRSLLRYATKPNKASLIAQENYFNSTMFPIKLHPVKLMIAMLFCLYYCSTTSGDSQKSSLNLLFPHLQPVDARAASALAPLASAQLPILGSVYSTATSGLASSLSLLQVSSTPINQSATNKRDLSSQFKETHQTTNESVCQVKNGESVAIVEIEESRGSDSSQSTNPQVLPISGSVELDELELKIESETHKYFKIENKSLKLTRPLDRDAVLKENSSQILQQPISSIYLQISCLDKRNQQQRQRKVIIPVLVKVLDLNDNAPKFSKPIYSVQVDELTPLETIISDQIHAIDLDSATNGQIEYTLLGQFSDAQQVTLSPSSTSVDTALSMTTLTSEVPIRASSQRLVQRVAGRQQQQPATSTSMNGLISGISSTTAATTNQASIVTTTIGPMTTSSSEVTAFSGTTASSTSVGNSDQSAVTVAKRKNEPTINLNSEPIVNGAMEEDESEEESDEELLAAMDAQSRQQYSSNASTTMHGLDRFSAGSSASSGDISEDDQQDEDGNAPVSTSELTGIPATRPPNEISHNKTVRRRRKRRRTLLVRRAATTTDYQEASSLLTGSTSLPTIPQDLPWTNLLAGTSPNSPHQQQQQQQQQPEAAVDLFDSSDYFSLEMSPQSGRPLLRLKKALDYESRRVHTLRVMATDKAVPKSERLSSYATIVVRVLDGDDQGPVFVLDQGGCATNSAPQTTTPSGQLVSQTLNEQMTTFGRTSTTASSLEDLTNNGTENKDEDSVGEHSSEFWDTLGLDDHPLDIHNRRRTTNRKSAWRTSQQSEKHSQVFDYLCLSSAGSSFQQRQGEPTQIAEYQATVMSGESDYVLRIAPQAIRARDRDQINAPIRYTFLNGTPENFSSYFQMNALDASVKQIQPVEQSQIDQFQLWIQAQEQSDNKLSALARLTIRVVASDKSPPVLIPNSYAGQIEENSPVGARVLRLLASSSSSQNNEPAAAMQQKYLRIQVVDSDPKSGTRSSNKESSSNRLKASYEFDTTSDWFKVDPEGYVYVNKPGLDRDEPHQAVHMFQVTAQQIGLVSSRSLSSPISLNVTLLDQDDNGPVLLNSTMVPIRMAANSRGGSQVLTQVRALDKDLPGEHSRARFVLRHVSNGGQDRFRIDEDSGRIEALGKFLAGEQFSLTVQVQDELQRQSQGILDVLVIPGANTAGPQFVIDGSERDNSRGYAIEVNEAVPVNSVVLQVRAVDPENDQISYSLIEQGNVQGSDFSINSKTGIVSVAARLDREEISAYNLLVQARDSGGLATTRPIRVTIGDSNDNNPQFEQKSYSFEVAEGTTNQLIGRVQASDLDAGENGRISYSLQHINTGNSSALFEIDQQTGEIRILNEPLDFEQQQVHSLLVIASDGGEMPRSSSVSVQIRVRDIQDELPQFERFYLEVTLDENQPAGQKVATMLARDPDSVPQISYILLAGDSSSFAIDSQTGVISTLQGLDYESARTMTILVGTNESFASGAFDLVGASNKLNEAIELAKQQQQDTSSRLLKSAIARIDVHVNDLNDNAPQFEWPHESALLPVRVQDSTPLGQQVMQLHARDRDASVPNNQVRFELVRDSTQVSEGLDDGLMKQRHYQIQKLATSERCARLFHVDSSSGAISVSSDLRRDQQLSECQLVVRAHDLPVDERQQLSSLVTVTLLIDHLADISPNTMIAFADSRFTVELSEQAPGNSLVKVLPIVNKIKSAMQFPIACDIVQGNELGKFQAKMNDQYDCELRTSHKQTLDAETRQRYSLTLRLSPIGAGSSSSSLLRTSSSLVAQVQVNILDENDNRPVFVPISRYAQLTQQRYLAAVASDAPSETQVIQLRAQDADLTQPNNLITYELIENSDYSASLTQAKSVDLGEQDLGHTSVLSGPKFKIDNKDGIVRTAQSLEDISPSRLPLRLRVLVRDHPHEATAVLESRAELVINLINERHRIALVLKDIPVGRVLENREQLLAILQERSGLIAGLERIESMKTQRNNGSSTSVLIEPDVGGTDVWFYLIEPGTLRIVPSDDPRLRASLLDSRAQNSLTDVINQSLGFAKTRVRLPFALNEASSSSSSRSARFEVSVLGSLMRAGNSANDRLAPALILIALFIAIFSAIVVVYQCGSISGLAKHQSTTSAKQSLADGCSFLSPGPAQMNLQSQQPTNGPLDHFFLGPAGLYGQPAPSHFGTLDKGYSAQSQAARSQQQQLSGARYSGQSPAAAAAAAAKEYETQMLKMSVIFDDNQSFDEQNLQDRPLVNQNLS